MNIIATDKDAWDGVSVKNAGCYFPWEHKNFDGMMNAAGLVDSYRIFTRMTLISHTSTRISRNIG